MDSVFANNCNVIRRFLWPLCPNWNALNWIVVVNWKLVEIIDWYRTGFSAIGAVLMQCQLRALDWIGKLNASRFCVANMGLKIHE